MQHVPQEEPISLREKRKPLHKRIMRIAWALAILGVLAVAGIFIGLSFTDLPTFEQLENPKSNLATEVYASNGELLGRYYVENRVPVTHDQLSPNLVNALVATEDERYYGHSGIDLEALGRAIVKTFFLQDQSGGGASTITQQLAKQLFTEKPGSGMERLVQKLKEWIIAVKLERSYTKEEIIAMYLNKFNFINGAYGIKAASETYFGETQDSLNIIQSALLVGMLKNPSLYNPIRFPEKATKRREVVLKQMQKNDLLTQVAYDTLRVKPLGIRFERKTHADGIAPYFRMELRKEINRILEKKENRKPNGDKYDIYEDGLKIFTTLDPVIQRHAESAMKEHMSALQQKFYKRWKNKDPWTYEDPTMEEEEIEMEKESKKRALKRAIQATDRYKQMRIKYVEEVFDGASKNLLDGFTLRDVDLERMMKEEEEKGHLTKLVAKDWIDSKLAGKYRKLMQDPQWDRVKVAWLDFQRAIKAEFRKEVPMRVFAYTDNNEMEVDTVMSPLDSIKYHRNFLQLGSVAVDPVTGYVKAWVGGVNYKHFQYDHVTSERQVGSTFKPFIYATAISQQGISPCFSVMDWPVTIHKGEGNFGLLEDWTPANANGKYSGEPFTLFKGLQYSKNTVSVFLMKQLGDTEPVRVLVDNMGLDKTVKRSNGAYRIPRQPSIALGASDLTVLELTGAYTTFANDGRYNRPTYITRIEDRHGRTIYQEIPEERIALNPNHNHVMLEMLKAVVSQGLPGFSKIESELAGKTGTTNDYVDGWFMGLTPDLVVGTWVGGDDRWVRFTSIADGIGAKLARPFFAKLLQRLEDDTEADYDKEARFVRPSGDIGIVLDCELYRQDNQPLDNFFDEEGGEDESFGNDYFGEDPVKRDSTNRVIAEDEDFGDDFNE